MQGNRCGIQRLFERAKYCAVAGLLLTGSGCAMIGSAPGAKTEYRVIVPAGAESYEQPDNQTFILGDRIGVATLPVYPQAVISHRLPPQTVCIEIDIDTLGQVPDSRALYGTSGCPEQSLRPDDLFLEAATAAVTHWTFSPARICTYPAGTRANEDCSGQEATIELVPVRLAYLFLFELDGGRPQVVNHPLRHD